MTPEGRERPVAMRALGKATLLRINAVCPGTRIDGPDPAQASSSAMKDAGVGLARTPQHRARQRSRGALPRIERRRAHRARTVPHRFRPRQIRPACRRVAIPPDAHRQALELRCRLGAGECRFALRSGRAAGRFPRNSRPRRTLRADRQAMRRHSRAQSGAARCAGRRADALCPRLRLRRRLRPQQIRAGAAAFRLARGGARAVPLSRPRQPRHEPDRDERRPLPTSSPTGRCGRTNPDG